MSISYVTPRYDAMSYIVFYTVFLSVKYALYICLQSAVIHYDEREQYKAGSVNVLDPFYNRCVLLLTPPYSFCNLYGF